MPSVVARLILSLAAIVGAGAAYVGLFIVLEETLLPRDFEALLVTSLITCVLFGGAWILIWLGEVPWNGIRIGLTAGSVGWSMGVAAIIGLIVVATTNEEELGAVLGSMFWLVAWLVSTAMVWRETGAERRRRLRDRGVAGVPCPTCGYDLTGLHQAKCPECGSSYTLDQLFAAILPDRALEHAPDGPATSKEAIP